MRYYVAVAPAALAGIRDRPLVLKRFVNGAEQPAFYQKREPGGAAVVDTNGIVIVSIRPDGGRAVVDDAAGLAWVVNLGDLESGS